jgi:hypothetical protein
MNKVVAGVLVATGALCVVSTQAFAGGPQKSTGGVTYINGPDGGTSKLEVNGTGTPAAGDGRIKLRNLATGADYVGQVSCYNQYGNTSRMTGVITSGVVADGPNGGLKDGTGLYFSATVQDNGEGAKASGPDLVAVNHRATNPFDCSVQRTPERVVTNGNLQVHNQTASALRSAGLLGAPSDWSADEVSD